MKILIRLTASLVLASFMVGCTDEILIRSVVLLILLSTLIKCTQAILSTPYLPSPASPAEALPLATAQALSNGANGVYRVKIDHANFVDASNNPYFPSISGANYNYGSAFKL